MAGAAAAAAAAARTRRGGMYSRNRLPSSLLAVSDDIQDCIPRKDVSQCVRSLTVPSQVAGGRWQVQRWQVHTKKKRKHKQFKIQILLHILMRLRKSRTPPRLKFHTLPGSWSPRRTPFVRPPKRPHHIKTAFRRQSRFYQGLLHTV